MIRIYTAIHLTQPVEVVFDYVTTPGHWPRWHPSSLAVSGATGRSLMVGEQVTEEFLVAGRRGQVVWTVNSAQKAGVPWMAPRQGREGDLEFFKILGEFQFKNFQVLLLMAGDNQVAAEIVVEADVPRTGGHFREEEIHLWTCDSVGQVIRFRHYLDTAKHIAVAGGNAAA
jgi:ketosteroid isomerase-like protein